MINARSVVVALQLLLRKLLISIGQGVTQLSKTRSAFVIVGVNSDGRGGTRVSAPTWRRRLCSLDDVTAAGSPAEAPPQAILHQKVSYEKLGGHEKTDLREAAFPLYNSLMAIKVSS